MNHWRTNDFRKQSFAQAHTAPVCTMKEGRTILNSDFHVNPLGPFWSRDVFNRMRHFEAIGL